MDNRLSKICWNDKGWQFPSGSIGKSSSSKSFEAEYGFGHEEWLFDKTRMIGDYHYGFLQPLNLKSDRHANKTYNMTLFTITNRKKYMVGRINNAQCISKAESKTVYNTYKRNNWLKQMAAEIVSAGADPRTFLQTQPEVFFNVKFRFDDVVKDGELYEISASDTNITTTRYKLLPIEAELILVTVPAAEETDEEAGEEAGGNLRNTNVRIRNYQVYSELDPIHDKMQNGLYELLRTAYTQEYNCVLIERDRVDIKARTLDGKWHYFEIKTAKPKLSIRNALGQIIEYSCYPESEKADRLIIVADEVPDDETIKYIAYLRRKYGLPIYYQAFDLVRQVLSPPY